jgi:hypothetical protein
MNKFKKCTKCQADKLLSAFGVKNSNPDGLEYHCKDCYNTKQRDKRSKMNNHTTKKYEKTLKGKLVRTYRNMLSRVRGILKNKSHLYEGLEILDKECFYEWSLNNQEYLDLFKNWVEADYDLKLSPSIDRINPLLGYTLDNIRWVTFEFNSLNTSCRKNKYSK